MLPPPPAALLLCKARLVNLLRAMECIYILIYIHKYTHSRSLPLSLSAVNLLCAIECIYILCVCVCARARVCHGGKRFTEGARNGGEDDGGKRNEKRH